MNQDHTRKHLIAVFFLFVAFFNYPLIQLLNGSSHILGVPRFFAMLFMAWLCMIACLFIILEVNPSKGK